MKGIEVVRQISSKEKELNGGRPLAFEIDSPAERAAVLTRLTYCPPPPPPPGAAVADRPPAASLPEEEVPPCPAPAPPADAPAQLFVHGAARAVGSYFAERSRRERGLAATAPAAPPRVAASLPAPRGGAARSGRATAMTVKAAATMPQAPPLGATWSTGVTGASRTVPQAPGPPASR